jgi:prepilin-type N-terminal cleavage/methylation domain-containing protein
MTIKNQDGFSLFEVLIAISVFAVFFIVFANSFFQNQRASSEINEEMLMSTLAEKIIRETLISPPVMNESLHKSNKKENFEDANYKDYSYSVEWARLELPNFGELMKLSNQDQEQDSQQSIVGQVFKQVQESTKDILWQLRLTIVHTPSGRQYPVSLWIKNPDKEITLTGVGGKSNPNQGPPEP